jgi:phosphoribosylformylglycinamidine synthase
MHYLGKVKVRFKNSVLEPQGKAIELQLGETHHAGIESVRVGKWIEVKIDAVSADEAMDKLQRLSEEILYNPVMEICDIEVEPI